jgi:hypothetical protein
MTGRLAWIAAQRAPQVLTGLALLLLGLGTLLHALLLPALERRAEAAIADADRRVARSQPVDPAVEAGRELQAFYRHVDGGSLPDQLARLYAVARTTGVTLRQGEYRLLRDGDARLRRYQIVLPVHGSYPGLRQFVSATLRSLPNAALEQVSFERRRIEETEVEAQLRLTIYLQECGT